MEAEFPQNAKHDQEVLPHRLKFWPRGPNANEGKIISPAYVQINEQPRSFIIRNKKGLQIGEDYTEFLSHFLSVNFIQKSL